METRYMSLLAKLDLLYLFYLRPSSCIASYKIGAWPDCWVSAEFFPAPFQLISPPGSTTTTTKDPFRSYLNKWISQ